MKTSFLTLLFLFTVSTTILASCKTAVPGASNTSNPSAALTADINKPSETAQDIPQITPVEKVILLDTAECAKMYYLFRQSLRDWENSGDDFYFYDLMDSWTYLFAECQGYKLNIYINGVTVMEYRISKLAENERKGAIDTLMMIYDQRILYFGEEAFVLGEKAAAMVKFRPENTEEIYKLLSKVLELNGKNIASHLLVYYMQYAVFMHEAGKMEIEKLIDVYLNVDEIAHHNVDLNNATSAEYKDGIERIEQLMLKYLECDVMENVFKPRFLADSTNLELCKKIVALMAYNKCYDQPLFRSALNQLNRLEPTPKLLLFQARFYQNDGNYPEAIKVYLKAAESFSTKEADDKFDAYLKASELQMLQKQYQNAKSSVLKALEIKPDDPNALIQLGDIYLYGASTCGSAFIAKYAGVWAAYDKYLKAKGLSNDAQVQQKANEGMNNARRGFPPTSDIFFNKYKVGQTVTAPCWIGETVTIRASDS